jgi:hypothetical protein
MRSSRGWIRVVLCAALVFCVAGCAANREVQDAPISKRLTGGQLQDGVVRAGGDEGLRLRVDGAAMLEVRDPRGRWITYDASVDRYVSDIPKAIVVPHYGWSFQIPDAEKGLYLLKVTGEDNGKFWLSAIAWAGRGPSSDAVVHGKSQGSPIYYIMNYTGTAVSTPTLSPPPAR